MKMIFNIRLTIIGIALSVTSCNVVNLDPISSLTEANFYNTADDMNRAVLGIYSSYQSRLPRDWSLLEMPSDHLYMSPYRHIGGLEAINNLDFQPHNDIIRNFWQTSYNGIFRANSVLKTIDNPRDYTGSLRNQLEGEAKFMRALFYFDLVRTFGGVPKVDGLFSVGETKEIPRATAQEIYDFIISDLKDAIEKLPVKENIASGRASKGAAVGLLGKVYIYLEDWANAYEYLDRVSDYGYDLMGNFADLWSVEHEDNSEGIFVIKYLESANGHMLSRDFLPYFGVEGVTGSAGGEVALVAWSLHKNYQEADTRKSATITEYWRSPGSLGPEEWRPYISKFIAPNASSSGLDIPVLRYADIVLLKSEALYHLNNPEKALVELNRIRERAFGNASHNYSLPDIATIDDFLSKLLLERQLELAIENQRWFDLVRMERYLDVMADVEWMYNPITQTAQKVNLNPKSHYRHFPIPQHEIDQSNPGVLKQNPGY